MPFEDILGVGHEEGFNSIIVPGSGEANYDALELNPYESVKQRQQQEVRSLLDKLPADTIALDPNVIGTVDKRASTVRLKPGEITELADKTQQSKDKMEIKSRSEREKFCFEKTYEKKDSKRDRSKEIKN